MDGLATSMYVYHMCAVFMEAGRGHWMTWTKVTDAYQPYVETGTRTWVLRKSSQMLLTAELSLQVLRALIWIVNLFGLRTSR